jgi:hypothetical protein
MRFLRSLAALIALANAPNAFADESAPGPAGKSAKAERAPPPRPAPLEPLPEAELPKERRADIGAQAILVSRVGEQSEEGRPTFFSYSPGIGLGLSLRIPIFENLQVSAYAGGSRHAIHANRGGLGLDGDITSDALETYWLGAKALPTLVLNRYVRGWLVAGVAWGRYEFPEMQLDRPGRESVFLFDRGHASVEFPLGFGLAFDVVEDWLSIDLEMNIVPSYHFEGTSTTKGQLIDGGATRDVGPLPTPDLTTTQSIGVSLLL